MSKRRVIYEDQWHKEVATALAQLREFGSIQDTRLNWSVITAPLCGTLAGSHNTFGGVRWELEDARGDDND